MANHSPHPDDETDAIRREREALLRKITGAPLIGSTGGLNRLCRLDSLDPSVNVC